MRRTVCLTLAFFSLLAFASQARAADPGVVYGTRGASGTSVDAVERTSDLGVGWVRLFADWSAIEPSKGQYTNYGNTLVDTVLALKKQNKKVLLVAFATPAWASSNGAVNGVPRDDADYVNFVKYLIGRTNGAVDAWEIWNEPDGPQFWAGTAAQYAQLLKASYGPIKAADPDATVVSGGMVGNDFDFVQALYDNGAKGSFDAVGVHTDTACLQREPEYYYREPSGRIGRYVFTGYREVHDVMAANGDADKTIWMTELGWSTTAGLCTVGERAGQQNAGVSEANQADYLKRAYSCLAADPYVSVALWFSLQDIDANARPGTIRDNGTAKPAYDALKSVARGGVTPNPACGGRLDHTPPVVTIAAPTAGTVYLDRLPVLATATDDSGAVSRMEIWADGVKVPGMMDGGKYDRTWLGARDLTVGVHTITVKAYDEASNVGQATVQVTHGTADQLPSVTPGVDLKAKKLAHRKVRLTGGLILPHNLAKPNGAIRIVVQQRKGKGWAKVKNIIKAPGKRFSLSLAPGKGSYRVQAIYLPKAKPFNGAKSKRVAFTL